MQILFLPLLLLNGLLVAGCTEAQSNKSERKTAGNSAFTKLGSLPRQVAESSGLANAPQKGSFYTIGDAGNKPVLFKVNQKGELEDMVKLNVPNHDWESLSEDTKGYVYIADCGNNENKRRDLVIYKMLPEEPDQLQSIKFSYPDQKDFPPQKKARNFDSEATLWHNGQVYIFTRDRGRRKTSKVYAVPDKAGEYIAEKVAEIAVKGQVTGADLSQDGKKLVLVSDQKFFLLEGADFASALKASPVEIKLPGAGQTEGILFTDNQTLLISSEGGTLYSYRF